MKKLLMKLTKLALITGFVLGGLGLPQPASAQAPLGCRTQVNNQVTCTGSFTWTAGSSLTAPTISATTKFLAANGTAAAPSLAFTSDTHKGFYSDGTNLIGVSIGSTLAYEFTSSTFEIRNGNRLGISSSSAADSFVYSDAANTLACRNGTSACLLRIYDTYTSSTNGEWLDLGVNSVVGADAFTVMARKGSGGGAAQSLNVGTDSTGNLNFLVGGAGKWRVDGATGNFLPVTDATVNFGDGSHRVGNLFMASYIQHANGTRVSDVADGKGKLTTSAATAGVCWDVTSDGIARLMDRTCASDAIIQASTLRMNSASSTQVPFFNSNGDLVFSTNLTWDGTDFVPANSRVIANGAFKLAAPAWIRTAPTVSSGFGSGAAPVATNGTAAFTINVGTGGTASSGVIGLPAATTGWAVTCNDLTTPGINVTKQTGVSTTSATVTNYNSTTGVAAAWTASDVLYCQATAF